MSVRTESEEGKSGNSSKVWMAAIGALGFLASLFVSLLTIGGVVLGVGVWKGNLDVRVAAVETASKEQIAAVKESGEKQVQAVMTAAKEMVAALERSTDKRLTDIETDRRAKIEDFQRFKSETSSQSTKMETLLTNQQKQLDTLVELSARRTPR